MDLRRTVYEVEVKLELLSAPALKSRLKSLQARPVSEATQHDIYFADRAGGPIGTTEVLRWRQSPDGDDLTYKGTRLDVLQKARLEHVVQIATDPTGFLEALGYLPAVRISKRRQTWRLDDVTVCIDEIEGLGAFAEVEQVAENPERAAAKVEQAITQLGLEGAQRFAQSYVEMALAAGLDCRITSE